MRKAVFGGTFDPPHNAHIMIASTVLSMKLADKVLFVPAFNPPHKTGQVVTEYSHRLEMLKLTLKDFSDFEISEIESEYPDKPSYSLDTMRELSARFPETSFVLLIGSDSLRQLHTWHNAHELVDEFDFIIYPRPDEIPSETELIPFWTEKKAHSLRKRLLKMPVSSVSSSEIRRKIFENKSVDNLINADVKCYICTNRIYSGGGLTT
ncbi:MAG: nicotinate (nicotinamide) nucleotide adenylyltransferase [Lentisphaerae bacterium GWF2_45_14]|nr:MAG: nicotinate (nicotinamide) nucleotide adenylyltransferase [Lentisphaerae bacterium GWF2_45_14]